MKQRSCLAFRCGVPSAWNRAGTQQALNEYLLCDLNISE